MTTARSLLVDPETPGFYHCSSRCVRRAWLCGIDPYDGKSCEYRREWVEGRLLELAEVFAVGIYACAVMSNHVHVVLRIDPETAATWTSEEVATRWVRLFPATVNGEVDALACRTKEQNLLGTETRYWRAIGSVQSLIEKAAAIGQHWLKGIGSAETLMRPQRT